MGLDIGRTLLCAARSLPSRVHGRRARTVLNLRHAAVLTLESHIGRLEVSI